MFFKITTLKRYLYYIFVTFLLFSCGKPIKKEVNGAFARVEKENQSSFSQIKEAGELIVTTLSGPDTYYDYQGIALGKEYLLMSHFASSEGLRLRVELAHDTTEMVAKLKAGEVDVIAYQLPMEFIEEEGLLPMGADNKEKHTSWVGRVEEKEMAAAMNCWWAEGKAIAALQQSGLPATGERVKRHIYTPYLSREKGQISTYDPIFKEAAQLIGWDWKLIAAQCYQESAFDAHAISWAGAKGLMQLMPATAAQMGVKEVYDPRENVLGGARYLQYLNKTFGDIPNGEERIRFVLAAYNAGPGHIRDAMALAKKYGKVPTVWRDVSEFVLALEQVKYYRDPVVKYGYMIGRQTYDYVSTITTRYQSYGGVLSLVSVGSVSTALPTTATPQRGRHKILTPDDPAFLSEE